MKKQFRIVSFIMAMTMSVLLCGCNVSVNLPQEKTGDVTAKNDTLLTPAEEYPFYYASTDNESTIKLYFADEGRDIPYIDIDTAKDLIERMFHESNGDEGFELSISEDGNTATLTRENSSSMSIDTDNDVISFDDYDSFIAPSWSKTVIDTLEHYGTIDCLQINEDRSYSCSGESVEIDLGKYGIDLIEKDGKCYVPLQTFSDIAISLPCYVDLIYNKEAVYATTFSMDDNTEFISKSYSAGTGKRSPELAEFSYNELCMVMDHFYGLKDHQGIEDFDKYFSETGLKDGLLSEDPEESGKALAQFLHVYLDDLHSFYQSNSYLVGKDFKAYKDFGSSYHSYIATRDRLRKARKEAYPDEVPGYEEIGNTAYITFDVFDTLKDGTDYYKDPPTAETKDTVGLLLYSFGQITRDQSPVENVVFDMSLNGGGDQTTACFMLSMILGGSSMTVKDTLTGAYVHECFKADANLDGVFDDKDSLTGYNLYCIGSPISFSCANLAVSELKNSHIVTTLGQTSGGGTCIVVPFSLADGTLFRVSSCRRLSYIKNGAVYDMDLGFDPDIYIGKPSDFYDRESLTSYINSAL
ncbi:MAG: hypothetical protein J5367_03445 [Lachnospiraceae bacterium]|nr:hypothetical protein [Lachnospiraceae bacterium]